MLYSGSLSVSENTGAKNVVNMAFTAAVISLRTLNHTFEAILWGHNDNRLIQTAGNSNLTVTPQTLKQGEKCKCFDTLVATRSDLFNLQAKCK